MKEIAKRTVTVLLALAVIFTFTPFIGDVTGGAPGVQTVYAEEMPSLENVSIDSAGTMKWDAYPDTVEYHITIDGFYAGLTTFTSYDVDFAIDLFIIEGTLANSGTHSIKLQAIAEDGSVAAEWSMDDYSYVSYAHKKGWSYEFGDWYYYDADGMMVCGEWIQDGGEWYYLERDGHMVANDWARDNKGWMWMNGSGRITKDKWIQDGGYWYYLKPNGYMAADEWAKDGKGWMYMNSSGRVTKSKWIKDGGYWYYLKSNGYMAANEWASDSSGWMWMNSSGRITKNKWIKTGGYWYYLKPSGYMAANEWAKDGTGWMYMNGSGKVTKNKWIKYDGWWYYLKSNGYMATGTVTINGKAYKFDSSGRWKGDVNSKSTYIGTWDTVKFTANGISITPYEADLYFSMVFYSDGSVLAITNGSYDGYGYWKINNGKIRITDDTGASMSAYFNGRYLVLNMGDGVTAIMEKE